MGDATLSGHFASGLYAFHAMASASSPVFASFTGTSMMAMNDPPSGASRMVAGPFTTSDQPAGATKVFPATVVFGVSAAMRSDASAAFASTGIAASVVMERIERTRLNFDRGFMITPGWREAGLGMTDRARYRPRYDLSLIHISEPTRLLSISYAVFCLKKK